MNKPLLVLFDGNAIVHRAYHAFQNTRPLTLRRTGEIVSAVYGFAQMLLKAINDLKPTHLAVAFDRKGPTFRHHLYPAYKANRPPLDPALKSQMPLVRQVVTALNLPAVEMEGLEADDARAMVVARLARREGLADLDLTGVDLSGLDPAAKERVLVLLNSQRCDCGCNFGSIAECRVKDPQCSRSPVLAAVSESFLLVSFAPLISTFPINLSITQ